MLTNDATLYMCDSGSLWFQYQQYNFPRGILYIYILSGTMQCPPVLYSTQCTTNPKPGVTIVIALSLDPCTCTCNKTRQSQYLLMCTKYVNHIKRQNHLVA